MFNKCFLPLADSEATVHLKTTALQNQLSSDQEGKKNEGEAIWITQDLRAAHEASNRNQDCLTALPAKHFPVWSLAYPKI